jgi:hypothetical protein
MNIPFTCPHKIALSRACGGAIIQVRGSLFFASVPGALTPPEWVKLDCQRKQRKVITLVSLNELFGSKLREIFNGQ